MFNRLKGKISKLFSSVKKRKIPTKTVVFIRRKPLTAFVITLGLLLLLMVAGNLFKTSVKEIPTPEIVKEVSILTLGKTPTAKIAGQIEKQGVIQISAQASGIVSKISVEEGQEVKKGNSLISLSSNYQGGSAPSISRQIAQKQFENARDSYDSQKEIIQKQRDLANQNSNNTEDLRNISVHSKDDTNSLLDLNNDILSTINSNLDTLIANNVGGANDALILQTKQSKATVQSAVNSLQASVRSLDYSTDTSKAPTQIANINKDITLKQLDLQERALTVNKEISQLQLNLASVSEGLMFPVSPCHGVIQKVSVVRGELVNPGTPLVTIACENRSVKVVAKVAAQIANQASRIMESQLLINGKTVNLLPDFISTEATDGQLYQIVYTIPEALQNGLTDGSFIEINVPIGELKSGAQFFIPLDVVFQTQESAFVYVVQGDKAISKKVTLGTVLGSDIEVKSGLSSGDKIILDRNIIAGDKLKVKNP